MGRARQDRIGATLLLHFPRGTYETEPAAHQQEASSSRSGLTSKSWKATRQRGQITPPPLYPYSSELLSEQPLDCEDTMQKVKGAEELVYGLICRDGMLGAIPHTRL